MQKNQQRSSGRCGAVTPRMLIFLAMVSIPFVWFSYVYVSEKLNGGIERHGDYAEVNLKRLGCFPFDGRDGNLADVPARWRALDGTRVLLEGYMKPWQSSYETSEFEFVYNVSKCCFGGTPLVQERVFVRVPGGGSVPYTDSFVRVVGTLHVHVVKDAGIVQSVYTLDLERMRPVE